MPITRFARLISRVGQHAAAGPDLDDVRLEMSPSASHDVFRRTNVDQKILSEFRLSFCATAGTGLLLSRFRHVDPLSTPQLDSVFRTAFIVRVADTASIDDPAGALSPRREVSCTSPLRHPSASRFPRRAASRMSLARYRRLSPILVTRLQFFFPATGRRSLDNPRTVISSITVPFDDRYRFCSVLDGGKRSECNSISSTTLRTSTATASTVRQLGDYHDNAERFALFSRAVLEAAKVLGAPDILHCHDWQTALIPMLLKTLYDEDPAFSDAPCVFTIHNLGYQGLFPAGDPAAAHAAVGSVHHVEAGILRQGEFPEGRDHAWPTSSPP